MDVLCYVVMALYILGYVVVVVVVGDGPILRLWCGHGIF